MERLRGSAFVLGLQSFMASHEGLAPAVGRGVEEDSEISELRIREEGARVERKPRIEREGARYLQPVRVILKLDPPSAVAEVSNLTQRDEVESNHTSSTAVFWRAAIPTHLRPAGVPERTVTRLAGCRSRSWSRRPTLSSAARASRSSDSPRTAMIRKKVPRVRPGYPVSIL